MSPAAHAAVSVSSSSTPSPASSSSLTSSSSSSDSASSTSSSSSSCLVNTIVSTTTAEIKSSSTLCQTTGCGQLATLKCPTCISLCLPVSNFCSQGCFKKSWTQHNEVHKQEKARREFVPAAFDYRGPLRPHYVTPMRSVPDSIQKPDYHITGIPLEEQLLRAKSTILVYTASEIAGIRKACEIGRAAQDLAHHLIRPGITTEAIDVAVHEFIISKGAYPSCLNYHNFPKSCCTSVNEIICHGIPDLRPLQDGDIVNVDICVFLNGYHGDLNETYPVGTVADDSRNLIRATYDATLLAIQHVRPGVMCREFGDIISKFVSKKGLSSVRSYCGHGVGKVLHCPPDIPHYAKNKGVGVLKPGMIFTIEPMINMGDWRDVAWPDRWTISTIDGKRSAQFEHTILVTDKGFEILTARTADSPKFFWEK